MSTKRYRCPICQKDYTNFELANACEQSHNIIYVPMSREQIDNLIQFFFTGNQDILDQEFVEKIMKLQRNFPKN